MLSEAIEPSGVPGWTLRFSFVDPRPLIWLGVNHAGALEITQGRPCVELGMLAISLT
jgi:hypothetical protein